MLERSCGCGRDLPLTEIGDRLVSLDAMRSSFQAIFKHIKTIVLYWRTVKRFAYPTLDTQTGAQPLHPWIPACAGMVIVPYTTSPEPRGRALPPWADSSAHHLAASLRTAT